MSTSAHPIALRLERRVGGATRLLATVMALPLVDGIFPALVIAGALTVPFGIIETGLLIFGGSATMAVVLAEMEGTPREKATSVLALGVVLVPVAMAEAALAETIQSMLNTEVFHRFAGLVILAVAAKTASAEIGEYLPSPGAIIGLGLLASFQPTGAELVVSMDPGLLVRAGAAAGVGVGFALSIALAGEHLRDRVDIDRFRFGSAVALGILALSVLGLLPTEQPVALGVLCVTGLFSYDPKSEAAGDATADSDSDGPPAPGATDDVADAPSTPAGVTTDGGGEVPDTDDVPASGAAADDATDTAPPTAPAPAAGIDPVDSGSTPDAGEDEDDANDADGQSREPWL
ncbi:DUF5794 domain-containing protein [Halobaculum sp. CBA1158]|uniref:DUF5794 domain-containing protein n=1 Tax=Halobaculum sp. CBA1158 TaxID=2904243 RepID=UPI001F414390|nr:DUF5794 domain-containing protein [Halobaculum sp. CBA1158]UIO99066.1 DUF5794 domain-containing protein [Halobaculum sp. CBA1158]